MTFHKFTVLYTSYHTIPKIQELNLPLVNALMRARTSLNYLVYKETIISIM